VYLEADGRSPFPASLGSDNVYYRNFLRPHIFRVFFKILKSAPLYRGLRGVPSKRFFFGNGKDGEAFFLSAGDPARRALEKNMA